MKNSAYHLYGSRPFQEANKAAVNPYRSAAYKCSHSQRTYAPNLRNQAQRNHFDAANTSCCGEGARPLGNKPAYKGAYRPMAPTDCKKQTNFGGCTTPQIAPPKGLRRCAGNATQFGTFWGRCPQADEGLSRLVKQGSIAGDWGTWYYRGDRSETDILIEYDVATKTRHDHYSQCLGTKTYTEKLGQMVLSYTYQASLDPDSHGGCYCDCCGDNGQFSAPTSPTNINQSGGDYDPDWANTISSIGGTVEANPACNGGTLSGTWHPTIGGGSATISWTVTPAYDSNGAYRKVVGTPGALNGSASNCACCGGYVRYNATDGCGESGYKDVTVTKSPSGNPTNVGRVTGGSPIYEGTNYTMKAENCCANCDTSFITYSDDCVDTDPGATYKHDADEIRRTTGDLAFDLTGSFACRACCGNGTLTVTANNGCGQTASTNITVNRPETTTAGDIIGYRYKCVLSGSWYVQEIARLCRNADSGSWSSLSTTNCGPFPTETDCLNAINAGNTACISERCQQNPTGGSNDCNTCCYYSNNNQASTSFRAMIFCWYGNKCCYKPYTSNVSFNNGSGASCCHNSN